MPGASGENGMSPRSIRARACALLCLLLAGQVAAQVAGSPTVSASDEFGQKRRPGEVVQPDGVTPFGEIVDAYDGSISWSQVDGSLIGAGPSMEIRRSFHIPDLPLSRTARPALDAGLGDWVLDIPRLETLSAPLDDGSGWFFADDDNRCAHLGAAPDAGGLSAGDWWHGYTLSVDGVSQTVLARTDGSTPPLQMSGPEGPIVFKGLTRKGWSLGCTTHDWRGAPTQGFVAVSPEGTQYWLDRMSSRSADSMDRGDGTALSRRRVSMLPSRVVDRSGNVVTYEYDDNDNLVRMSGPRGEIRFTWQSWMAPTGEQGWTLSNASATGPFESRFWGYAYSVDAGVPRLRQVLNADNSSWTFDMARLQSPLDGTSLYQGCDFTGVSGGAAQSAATMTGPSGITASFIVGTITRGDGAVHRICNSSAGAPTLKLPHAYRQASLVSKTYTGAGLDGLTWNYVYSPAAPSWDTDCVAGCVAQVWTDVIDPTRRTTRYTFSNRFDATYRQLLATDRYDSMFVGQALRHDEYSYAASDAGPWPARLGDNLQLYVNNAALETRTPLIRRITVQDGDTYQYLASEFDALGRPGRSIRSNSFSALGLDVRVERFDDIAHGVLDQPLRSVNVANGEEIDRTVYDTANSGRAIERWRFGRKLGTYSYDAQGNLAQVTDANGHSTTYGEYQGGVPTTTTYADGSSEQRSTDAFGQPRSFKDAAGITTSYGYAWPGHLSTIGRTGADGSAGPVTSINESQVYDGSAGLNGMHWARDEDGPHGHTRILFDALMRPVLVSHDGDGAVFVRYDGATERRVFESYKTDFVGQQPPSQGATTDYDGLGRVTQVRRNQPDGSLRTTSTTWSGHGQRSVTDPNGNVVLFTYLAFDQPAYNTLLAVMGPGDGTRTIERNVYGEPLSTTQGDTRTSTSRHLFYDSFHRLCRVASPERGSEIVGYDAADHVVWNVAGMPYYGAGCAQEQVAEASKTVRGYDAMYRPTSIVYPAGSDPAAFTYDVFGQVATATTGKTAWTYGRNAFGALTTATLAVDGFQWRFDYARDASGAVSSLTYPDGTNVAYAPDSTGRSTRVGDYATQIIRAPDGTLKSFLFGNGSTYLAQKDDGAPIRNLSYGSGGTIALSQDYGYDANGNLTYIVDVGPTGQGARTLRYDARDRLVDVAGSASAYEFYSYDGLDRLVSATLQGGNTTYTFDSRNALANASSMSGQHTYAYDMRGNPVLRDNVAYTFDAADHLLSIGNQAAYTYDAAGRRAKSVTPLGTTYHAYDLAGRLMWEYDPATAVGTRFMYIDHKLIAMASVSGSRVIGHVDGVVTSGSDAWLQGWACAVAFPSSISVNAYAGDPANGGVALGTFVANVASEPALQSSCYANGSAWRFRIALSDDARSRYAGRPLFVRGLPPAGGASTLLDGSGSVNMPVPSPLPSSTPAVLGSSARGNIVDVRWTAAAKATRYELVVIDRGQRRTFSTNASLPSGVNGLADGTYTFEVKPCNNSGCAAATVSAPVVVSHAANLPAYPVLRTGGTAATTATYSWAAVPNATRYELDQMSGGVATSTYRGAGLQVSVTAGSAFWYRLRACNANGCGVYDITAPVNVTNAQGTHR